MGAPLPRFRVWVFGVWVLGFLGSENLAKIPKKTLKLAKVGLAKVGQHLKTLKLAKVGLAKVGQAHDWPKSVKGLAKVGLAKVGHDLLRPISFST